MNWLEVDADALHRMVVGLECGCVFLPLTEQIALVKALETLRRQMEADSRWQAVSADARRTA